MSCGSSSHCCRGAAPDGRTERSLEQTAERLHFSLYITFTRPTVQISPYTRLFSCMFLFFFYCLGHVVRSVLEKHEPKLSSDNNPLLSSQASIPFDTRINSTPPFMTSVSGLDFKRYINRVYIYIFKKPRISAPKEKPTFPHNAAFLWVVKTLVFDNFIVFDLGTAPSLVAAQLRLNAAVDFSRLAH